MSGLVKKTAEDIRMRGYKAASKYDWKGMLDVFDELANLLEETQDQLAHVADDTEKALLAMARYPAAITGIGEKP